MSASSELQELIETTLRADAGVGAIVGDRIYDEAPPESNRTYPDVTFGTSDFLPDDDECITGRSETIQLDCWTRDHGRLKSCRALVDAVKAALHEADLTLSNNALVFIRVALVRVMRDQDGLTGHGVVQVTASVEEA